MDFIKFDDPTDNEIRIVHCKSCNCDSTEKASLNNKNSKATGG